MAKKTKSQMPKFEVTLRRSVEFTAVVEVEAVDGDQAKRLAVKLADGSGAWHEGDIVDDSASVKRL